MTRWLDSSRASRRNVSNALLHRVLRAEPLESRLALSGAAALQEAVSAPLSVGATAKTSSTVTLRPVADASVKATAPVTNFGKVGGLLVANDSSATASNNAETFLKFNLSSIDAPITKAVLKLTPIGVGKSVSSLTLGVELLEDRDDGWVEGKGGSNTAMTGPITWFNSPFSLGKQIRVAGSRLKVGKPIAIDVTSLLGQDLNANQTASFELKAVSRFGARQWVSFLSREGAKAGLRPVLVITKGAKVQPPPTVARQPTASDLTSTSVQLAVLGDASSGEQNLTYTWSAVSPAGAVAPTFSDNGANASKNTTAVFHQAGTYAFAVTITDRTSGRFVKSDSVNVTVDQSLADIQVTPSTLALAPGTTQQFAAWGLDQFGRSMPDSLSGVAWSVEGDGAIEFGTGLYTAPSTASVDTVIAHYDAFSDTATVTVTANSLGLIDPALGGLVESLDVDGSISRDDMLTIFRSPAATTSGIVTSTDLADLKKILSSAATLNMPQYVQVLAGDVINGNRANALYQGTTLGNLAAGSTAAQLDKLVSKWFLGTDHPASGGYSYSTVTGSLFPTGGPSHVEERQGNVGDCYLICSLGAIADSAPDAIQNMFVDNGVESVTKAHTWTVRFYANGVADYVTVDDKLPTDSWGNLVYQGDGSSASNPKGLWVALVEKAYAQWNETGKEGRNGENSYASLEAGWMDDVCAQVLGRDAASYDVVTASDQQALTSAVVSGKAVTAGTVSSYRGDGTLSYGLYGDHAYTVIGYNNAAKTFTLYNPWGTNQPAKALTWAELKTVSDGFVVADASGTQPIATSAVAAVGSPATVPLPAEPPLTDVSPAMRVAGASGNSGHVQARARLASRAVDAVLLEAPSAHQGTSAHGGTSTTWIKRHRAMNGEFGSPRARLGAIPADLSERAIGDLFATV